ncbi:unnamed protein product [Callosobruchus maculatus]|uniref:Uncharacterized protein n=1 Tax=Callosobruchus maculatus TaxID=64391 RepID=A0A653CTD0_CALMS|nr:unnamed protein product [Callosobruchus maculatus]
MMNETERIISEVKVRPCLWKTSCPTNSDVEAKKRAWQEVLNAVYSDYDEYAPEDKINIAQETQKKWRNVRDSFIKELNRQKRFQAGWTVKNRRPYRYFDHLKFLMENEDEPACDINGGDVSALCDVTIKTSKKRLLPTTDEEMTDLNDLPAIPRIHPDMAFFVSLLPFVQNLTEGQKLNFQMKVLKALQSVKKRKTDELSETSSVSIKHEDESSRDSEG